MRPPAGVRAAAIAGRPAWRTRTSAPQGSDAAAGRRSAICNEFIAGLGLPTEVEERLTALTPATYVGLSERLLGGLSPIGWSGGCADFALATPRFCPGSTKAGRAGRTRLALGGLYRPDCAPLWASGCGSAWAPRVSVGRGCRSGFVCLTVTCTPGNLLREQTDRDHSGVRGRQARGVGTHLDTGLGT